MEHRHLLPDEFETLLDGDADEATSALRNHVEACAECRAELAKRTELTRTLDHLKHHGPAPLFAYRVMSHVQVFEPWHVALRDFVKRLIPRTKAARWVAGVTAVSMAMVLTVAGVWAALNTESAWFFAEVGVKRVRGAFLSSVRGLIESAFGQDALTAVEGAGAIGSIIAISIVVAVILIAAVGFRIAAVASRRRRS